MMLGPNVLQTDRDALDDVGLIGDDDQIGTGDGAQHDEAVTAS